MHAFASSGLTPQQLALTVALGVALGILPILWGTTLLCAAAAFIFRLNQAGMQLVNYLCYPLQLALFLPFYRLGERIFPSSAPASVAGDVHNLSSSFAHMGGALCKAIMAWMLTAPLVMLLLYFVCVVLFRKRFPKAQPVLSPPSC